MLEREAQMHLGYLLALLTLPLLATVFRVADFARSDGEVRIAIWDCAWDQLRAMAVFGILGPPLGLLPFALGALIIDGEFKNILVLVPLSLLSYVVGAVPALASAVTVGALAPWLAGWPALWTCFAIGGVQSLIWFLAADLADTIFLGVACGGVAGMACARVFFGSPGKAPH